MLDRMLHSLHSCRRCLNCEDGAVKSHFKATWGWFNRTVFEFTPAPQYIPYSEKTGPRQTVYDYLLLSLEASHSWKVSVDQAMKPLHISTIIMICLFWISFGSNRMMIDEPQLIFHHTDLSFSISLFSG